jgi:hypothetical protein
MECLRWVICLWSMTADGLSTAETAGNIGMITDRDMRLGLRGGVQEESPNHRMVYGKWITRCVHAGRRHDVSWERIRDHCEIVNVELNRGSCGFVLRL